MAQTHSCDDTFETASLTLDNSRSFSDDDDFDQQLLLQEPTDNELLLQIMDGSEDEMVAAVEAVWRQDSKDIWGVEELRPIQLEALWHIVNYQSLLLVSRTGSGKTHFVRMMGTELGGIVVVVVPLLALMGDQLTKMKSVDGSVEAYNVDQLDEEADGFIDKKLIPRLQEMNEGTTSTVFLFVSPHYLTRHPSMIDAIANANNRKRLFSYHVSKSIVVTLPSLIDLWSSFSIRLHFSKTYSSLFIFAIHFAPHAPDSFFRELLIFFGLEPACVVSGTLTAKINGVVAVQRRMSSTL